MLKKNLLSRMVLVSSAAALITMSCGQISDTANEITNEQRVRGHWLMKESEHGGTIEKVLENETLVLSFKDGRTAFSPTNSVKGKAAYAALSRCNKIVRNYKTENNLIVFQPEGDCAEKRVVVQQLDGDALKFPDPEDGDVTRVFQKVDDAKYMSLVKASDRKL